MNRRADDQPSQRNSKIQNGNSTKTAEYRRSGVQQQRATGKKKTRKWTIGGLFKRRRTKNSDTDSSSEAESGERGFFTRSHRQIGGSYPVGNEFETRIIKQGDDGKATDLMEYKASPKSVIRTKRRTSSSNAETAEDSLEVFARRSERQKVKARVEARHLRLKDDSSDSESLASTPRAVLGSSSHSIHSGYNEQPRNVAKKSRTARTNRYLQRHGLPDAVINPQSQWVSNPIYQQETRYVPRAFSVVTSPVSSPVTDVKTRYESSTMPYSRCDSLYGRVWSHPQLQMSLAKGSSPLPVPPPPPPRNPNRRVTYGVNAGRPLSYAFDVRSRPDQIESFVNDSSPVGFKAPQNLQELSKAGDENSLNRYRADSNPRSRNPIQLIRPETEIAELNAAANKIGIPIVDPSADRSPTTKKKSNQSAATDKCTNNSRKRDKSRVQIKSKPKNLEEALLELEEIYNSLHLSDEDLLERAERRDLQAALRSNPNFSRYSCSDLDSGVEDTVNRRRRVSGQHPPIGLLSLSSRRSVVPDKVYDDMAYRKLRKKHDEDATLTPNVVSQSGSFLLVSPALSPPPLVRVPPSQTTSLLAQLNREPDITLDDVVFRNLKHSNDTLRIADPQPPFGIPVGPVSSAPNSDYLHAQPSDKYRSTFNPSRMPDLVKDDLAFRNLRKDTQSGHHMLPAALDADDVAKKRRAVRSLSANMIAPSKNKHRNDSPDANRYCSERQNLNHCSSFNNLPDVLEAYRSQQKELLRNCDECLTKQADNSIANEAKLLRLKLRELEALPLSKISRTKDDRPSLENKESFVKRVVVHKPVTLSQFTIVGDDHRDPSPRICDNSNQAENEAAIAKGVEIENSSSGVSSKSETPDSGAVAALNSICVVANNSCSESCQAASPSQLLPWRENAAKERRNQTKTSLAPAARQRSRIEITLSSPQEAGTILSEILTEFTPNANFLVFVVYVIAFLHQWLFTSFSICEIFMVIIALVAYYFINER